MKTLFSTFSLCLFLSFNLFAQLPDGSTAPNITFTDIDGNTHNLYDILDEGKSVVFDVMATWCGPCWNYHNTHILSDLYAEYGPSGTNEIEIFMVESSTSTNEACLYGTSGCSGGTFGDWTTGVDYPIVHITGGNGGSFNSDFNINYFPTLYKVCPNRKIYEVGQPPLSTWENWVSSCNLDATEDISNPICFGETESGIDLTIEGGHGNIAFSWSNGAGTEDLTGVPPGAYSCTITEGQGHSIEVGPFIVDGPESPLIVNIDNTTNISCAGDNDGSIFTTTSGGGTNYSYSWNNGASVPDLMNIQGGTYILTVTDSYGCTNTVTTFITEPPVLLLNTNAANENCDQTDGSIFLFANGGQGNYLYDIGNGPTTNNVINNLSAGDYSATVTDENGCSTVSLVTIENEPAPDAEAGTTETISCNDSSISLNGTGSTTGQNINYSWESLDGNIIAGENTLFPIVDQPGTYTLTVLNTQTGCQSSDDVSVEGDLNTPQSNAGEDGTLNCITTTITLDGSSSSQGAQFSYQWLDSSGEEVSTELIIDVDTDGTYELIVTNTDNGCSSTSSAVVDQDSEEPISNAGSSTEITCINTSVTLDGSNSSQGASFEYQWLNVNNEEIGTQLNIDITESGPYELIVTNTENGCTASSMTTVSENTNDPIANAGEDDEINCTTSMINLDGSASSQGASFEYQWLNSNNEEISTEIEVDVELADIYTLIVTNTGNGCTTNALVEITEDSESPIANAGNDDEINCFDNTINLDGSNSSEGNQFQYQWLNSNDEEISTEIEIEVNLPDTYTLIVSNTDNGCTSNAIVEITEDIESPTAEAGNDDLLNCSITNISLNGSASSEGSQFQYQWLNSNGEEISTEIETEVDQPDTYTLIVSNTENGCSSESSIEVSQDIEEPVADAGNDEEINCINNTINLDGSASSEGNQFEYQWLNSNDLEISTEVEVETNQPDTYILIVSNTDNGCTSEANIEITENIQEPIADAGNPETLNCTITQITLDGTESSTGSAFEYQWLDSNNEEISTNIEVDTDQAGTYQIIVTNIENGCTSNAIIEIDQDILNPISNAGPDGQLDCSTSSIELDGSGSSTGSIFEYQWLNSNNTNVGNDISVEVSAAEFYTLVVTNLENGCSATSQTEVSASTDFPTVEVSANEILTCINDEVLIDANGSSEGSNYNYQWFNENEELIGEDISINVNTPGSYTFLVTDTENGCSASSNVIIEEDINLPIVDILDPDVLNCVNTSTTLDASNSSASGDLNFLWSNSNGTILGTEETIDVSNIGTYQLTIVNTNNGCSASASTTVSASTDIPIAVTEVEDILNCTTDLVIISGQNSSASGPINFSWQDENGIEIGTDQNLDISNPGIYTLIITDIENGCSASSTAVVESNTNSPIAVAETSGILNCNNTLVNISGSTSSGAGDLTYSWLNANQIEIATSETIDISAPGTYTLITTDQENGCTDQTTVEISQDIQTPNAQAEANQILNCNLSEINIDGSGSSTGANISYLWSTTDGNILSNTNIQNPLIDAPGVYNLLVTNNTNGCSNSTSIEIEQIGVPVTEIISTSEVSCFEGTDGIAVLNTSGGAAPYTYQWPNGDTESTLNNLSAGTYIVSTTDAFGCENQIEVNISQPQDLIIQTEEILDNICLDDTQGEINISATGGTGNYTYQWSNGMNTATINNLENGTYTVLITDQMGCQKTESFDIISIDNIFPEISTQDIIISLDDSGNVLINADMINNGSTDNCEVAQVTINQESFDCSHIGPNEVILFVSDLAGNTSTQTAMVTVEDNTAPIISCIENIVSNSCENIEYSLPSVSDNCSAMAPILIEGLPSGSIFPEGTTLITYQAEDLAGNTSTCSFSITVENTIESTFELDHVSCNGLSDGNIIALPSGGTSGYTYLWNTGATTQSISDLSTGEYSVIITDGVGCQYEETITIDQPNPISITTDNITNEMGNDESGSIEVTTTGGTPNYNFTWTDSNGVIVSNEEDLINASAGSYTLTVTDSNGCTISSETYTIDNIVSTTSLDFEKYIKINPNPTTGSFSVNIELEEPMLIQLSVLDITGRVLLDWNKENTSTRNVQVSLEDFPNGIYLARVIIEGEVYVQRVILARP